METSYEVGKGLDDSGPVGHLCSTYPILEGIPVRDDIETLQMFIVIELFNG
jgi:hypothetical protein